MIGALLLVAATAVGASWPFDEPEAPAVALYPGSFAAPPVEHWVVPLPGGTLNVGSHSEFTRPLVVGEHIYVGGAAGDALYILSRSHGVVLGELPAAASVEAQPARLGELILFGDTGGTTWCYTLDGELRWKHRSGAPILASLTVADGRVFVSTVDDLGYALDLASGDLLWRYAHKTDVTREAELALYAAPQPIVTEDLVLMGFSDGALVGLDAATGDSRWARRVGEGRYPDLVAAPLVHEADVFASGYFQPLVAIDRSTRNVRWRAEVGAAAAPVVAESTGLDVLYHPGIDGKLRSYVSLTGAERWRWDSETNGALTTPIPTPAGMLVGSTAGGLYLVDPTTGEERWRHSTGELLTGISSAPVIAGRQLLFVTNAGNLHSMLSPPPLERLRRP